MEIGRRGDTESAAAMNKAIEGKFVILIFYQRVVTPVERIARSIQNLSYVVKMFIREIRYKNPLSVGHR